MRMRLGTLRWGLLLLLARAAGAGSLQPGEVVTHSEPPLSAAAQTLSMSPAPLLRISQTDEDQGSVEVASDFFLYRDGLLISEDVYFASPRQRILLRGRASAAEMSDLALGLNASHVGVQGDCNLAWAPTKPGFPPPTIVRTIRIEWFGTGTRTHNLTIVQRPDPPAPLCATDAVGLLAAIFSLPPEVQGHADSVRVSETPW